MCQQTASQPAKTQQAKPFKAHKKGGKNNNHQDKQICLDFLKGKCNSNRYHCKYAHPKLRENVDMDLLKTEPGKPKVCHIWVLTGYCKFGSHCRDVHPELDTQRKPKIAPPQQQKKLKSVGKPEKLQTVQPTNDVHHATEFTSMDRSNGSIEPMTPITPMTPMTPMTPSTPPTGLRQMSGCVEVCSDKSMMKVNGILNRLTVAKFDPLFRDLLKLMDMNPLMTASKVVSLVFDKAIRETREMAALYVELCRRLFETAEAAQQPTLNAYMFELIHAFLLTSLSQPVADEEVQSMTRAKQIGALNVMAEMYNKGMIDSQQISGVIAWLVHNTKQAEDKAMAALSLELLCSVLTSADQQLKRQCPAEHAQYLLGLMSVIGSHSARLQVLAMNVCALPSVEVPAAPTAAVVHVHCPYA
uniref:C3H1-type domain-containing protein n=1 Tax=Eutreptiella gymnastica TaxID=73025 RepID=A0A7S1NG48_9EUGL|mmetsp:Transcript_30647/g.55095  ORF Transcript_30647/g.55095 Transcript_30647/m.55095 type:complete len:414 (+) Transcript_30647:29-1270(+)